MNTISQSEILLQDATKEVRYFLHRFQVSSFLKRCNGYKQKGFPVIQLFTCLVTLMFQPLSTYMSMRVGAYKEPFSKNTIRRFCYNPSINWHKFLRILSQKLVSGFMRPATSENREEFFIFDDTPFHKSGKKTELVSKYFNHVNMKYGFWNVCRQSWSMSAIKRKRRTGLPLYRPIRIFPRKKLSNVTDIDGITT